MLKISNSSNWNNLIAALPGAHILQTWDWAQAKARLGWKPHFLAWSPGDIASAPPQAAALVLQRTLRLGGFSARMSVLYCPKGPLLDWEDTALCQRVLGDLQAFARRQGGIFIKIDPDVILATGLPGPEETISPVGQAVLADLQGRGWHFSNEQIQYRNTVQIDLTCPEPVLLERMKQKTRYNIRLAIRKGVTVREGCPSDLERAFSMYAETSIRDGFVIREKGYYLNLWETFMQRGLAQVLLAEVEGQPVAGLVLFCFGGRAWYFYGMSTAAHRELMPNYLLQWEAMRRAQSAGCRIYDLWGAPDDFIESDPMWGVFRFKVGLGGQLVRTLGAWDYPGSGWLYRLYTHTLPRLMDLMRRRGRARTRQYVSE